MGKPYLQNFFCFECATSTTMMVTVFCRKSFVDLTSDSEDRPEEDGGASSQSTENPQSMTPLPLEGRLAVYRHIIESTVVGNSKEL